MPLPFAIPLLVSAAAPAVDYTLAYVGVSLVGGAGLGAGGYYCYSSSRNEEALPTFNDTLIDVTQPVHADVGALVSATAERIAQDAQQSHEESVRMDAVLTSAEGHTRSLGECVLAASSQEAPNNEAIHAVTVNLEQQKLDIRVMAESLKNLPELLKARRDQKALLIENKQLKSTIEALEGKVSELTSCMDEALVFAEATQADNDALRQQLQSVDENKPNANTQFSFSIFRS